MIQVWKLFVEDLILNKEVSFSKAFRNCYFLPLVKCLYTDMDANTYIQLCTKNKQPSICTQACYMYRYA